MTQEEIDEVAEAICPRCRRWQPDLDGFGVVKCDYCAYCQHPHEIRDGDHWVCSLCDHVRWEVRHDR